MKRSEVPYPNTDDINIKFCSFFISSWEKGWFDSYSEDHFLIRAIENRLEEFIGEKQLIENNINQYNIVKNGSIDYSKFAYNFCINLSTKIDALKKYFGEEQIKNFVINQLSAGKEHYNEDCFFEALSEISILSFLSRHDWTHYFYEPILNQSNNKNPEARFEFNSDDYELKVNVEVKAPAFPHINHDTEKIIIPTILLSKEGRYKVKEYCNSNGLVYLDPRILKLRDFLNSATDKFLVPDENEYNLLYINWSYSLSACHIHLSFSPSSSVSGFLIPNSQFQIPNSSSARPKDSILSSPTRSSLPRKEVIQPHLPIRLPCYDFTPVIGLTFGS